MQAQYQKGEYVRYAANGVCLVEDIRQMPELKRGDLFYVLRPIADQKSTYYIPIDNEKLTGKLRPVLTRDEVNALIDSVHDAEMIWIEDRKQRVEQFHAALRACDLRQLMVTACTLYLQKQSVLRAGKKLTPSDETVLRQAEALVDNEIAFVLDLPVSGVGTYIRNRLGME